MCARHSKVIDSEPDHYNADVLQRMKALKNQPGPLEVSQADARSAELLLRNYRDAYIIAGGHVMLDSPGSVQASSVIINSQRKTLKILPPTDSLASSLSHRNYVKHLIDRYHEFAREQPGRRFRFPAIYAQIKNRYGAKWDLLPLRQFDDLVLFLQQHVDRTKLGSINRAKGIPNYSTFLEFRRKYEGL
jgi:hypothetical protein